MKQCALLWRYTQPPHRDVIWSGTMVGHHVSNLTTEVHPERIVVQWLAPSFWVHSLDVGRTGRCTKNYSCFAVVERWMTFLLYGYGTRQCFIRSHHSYVFVGILRGETLLDCHPPLNWDHSEAGLWKWTMILYEYAGQWASSAKKSWLGHFSPEPRVCGCSRWERVLL